MFRRNATRVGLLSYYPSKSVKIADFAQETNVQHSSMIFSRSVTPKIGTHYPSLLCFPKGPTWEPKEVVGKTVYYSRFDELHEHILRVKGNPIDRRPTNDHVFEELLKLKRGGCGSKYNVGIHHLYFDSTFAGRAIQEAN